MTSAPGAHEVDGEPGRDAVAARRVLAVDDEEVGLVPLAQERDGGAHGVAARFADDIAEKDQFHEGDSVEGLRAICHPSHGRRTNDPAIAHLDDAMRGGGDIAAVGDHDDRRAVTLADIAEKFDDERAGFGIEVAGRLIGQQNPRLHEQRPRERRPLHFAAGKLVQPVPRAMLHADGGEQFRAPALDFLRRLILQQAGQAHVFLHRQRRQQVEELEDETDFRPAQPGQARLVEPVDRFAVEVNFAAGQDVESAQHMQQRALAATARPHDGHEFAMRNVKTDPVERVDRRAVRIGPAVKLGGVLDADHVVIFLTRSVVDLPGTSGTISIRAPHSRRARASSALSEATV